MIKDYVKYFENLQAADGYSINDIPFITTISGETPQNLICNKNGMKIVVNGDQAEIVGKAPLNTKLYLNDGSVVELTGTSITEEMTRPYRSSVVSVEVGNDVTWISGYTTIDTTTYYPFWRCPLLTSVTISDSVTLIGDNCFYECTKLEKVTLGNSLKTIKSSAFRFCASLTTINIPDSVTTIETYTFDGCTSLPVIDGIRYADTYLLGPTKRTLTSYTIREDTKWIGSYAFSGCTNLTDIIIPESVVRVDGGAFNGCTSLPSDDGIRYADTFAVCTVEKSRTSYTIKNGTKWIASFAFYGTLYNLTQMTSIVIPDTVTSIGSGCFQGCYRLSAITIPDSVVELGSGAFYDCTALTSVQLSDKLTALEGSTFYNCKSLTSVTIPSGVTEIANYAFYNCALLGGITIPSGVNKIGNYAFYGCTSLSSINIPSAVTTIEDGTFSGCTSFPSTSGISYADTYLIGATNKGLTSYTIKEGTKWIGPRAFYYCTSATSIDLKDEIVSIGASAFTNCSNLTEIVIPNKITTIGGNTFRSCLKLTNVTLPNNLLNLGTSAFQYCTSLSGITLPDSLVNDGYSTGIFANCSALSSIVIPNNVTKIDSGTFDGCTSLSDVTIGTSVTSIGYQAFRGCTAIEHITIPNNVKTIDGYAFDGCTNLSSVTLGNSVTSIAAYAFSDCTSLSSINIPDSVTGFGDGPFFGCTSLPVIDNVRYADTYLVGVVNTGLTTYTIQSNTKWIGYGSFSNCYKLTTLTLPNSVNSIESYAFNYCTGLTSIVIPNGVTTLKSDAFRNCNKLSSVTISTGVTLIYPTTFTGCTSLPVDDGIRYADWYAIEATVKNKTSYTLRNTTRWINSNLFKGNTSLRSVTLPSSMYRIGPGAFSGCTNMTGITIPENTSIGEFALAGCTKLPPLYVPSSVPKIEHNAFYNIDVVVYNGPAGDGPWGAKHIGKLLENGLLYRNLDKEYLVYNTDKTITAITIPDTVKVIGQSAFYNNTSLKTIVIPSTVARIETYAFSQCTGAPLIEIPSTITNIETSSFNTVKAILYNGSSDNYPFGASYYGKALENNFLYYDLEKTDLSTYIDRTITAITIPNNVTKLGSSSLSGALFTSLTDIHLPSGLTSIGARAFYATRATGLTIPDTVTEIGIYAFQYSQLRSVVLPSGITEIADSLFYSSAYLTGVTFLGNITSVGVLAFNTCSNLVSLTLPDSLRVIKERAFAGCTGLRSINLPSGLTSIESQAFESCRSLTDLTIPSSITTINTLTFEYCTNLTLVVPDTVTTINNSAFLQVFNVIYHGSATGSPWGALAVNGVVDGDFLFTDSAKTTIASCKSSATGEITIPSTVTTINGNAFSNCKDITSVVISNNVTTVDSDAFYYGYGEDWSSESPCPIQTFIVSGETYVVNGEQSIEVTLANGTSVELYLWTYYCFLGGTQITLANGATKAVEDIQYSDELKVWNFDEGHYDTAYPLWISTQGILEKYYKITLDDGTVLKVSGANTGHKIYNTDEHKFEGCIAIKVGTHVYTENGIKEIVSKETIEENVPYYNLMTNRHINCFAEGVLTSMRYNSIYPFSEDMKFIKDGRELRPYSEFEAVGISYYWYEGLRLAEQTDSLERIDAYVKRLESKMLPRD